MARSTYISEALTIAGATLNRKLEDNFGAYIANVAQNKVWNKYDWRESLAPLPPFYLLPNEQEYGAPATIVPSDFQGLREAYLVNMNATPASRMELKVRRDVRATGSEALPTVIGYEPSIQRFRVFPRAPGGIGATDWVIDGTYKIRPVKITPSTLQTTLVPWDDIYLNTFISALRWAALDASGDPRAGTVEIQNGIMRYTGALAVMHDSIDEMAQQEGLNLGDPSVAPAEPLVGGYGLFPRMGIY